MYTRIHTFTLAQNHKWNLLPSRCQTQFNRIKEQKTHEHTIAFGHCKKRRRRNILTLPHTHTHPLYLSAIPFVQSIYVQRTPCSARYCAVVCLALKLEWINHKKINWKENKNKKKRKENRRINKQPKMLLHNAHCTLCIANQSEWMKERMKIRWMEMRSTTNRRSEYNTHMRFHLSLSACAFRCTQKISPIKTKWNCCIRFTWCLKIIEAIWFAISCYYF